MQQLFASLQSAAGKGASRMQRIEGILQVSLPCLSIIPITVGLIGSCQGACMRPTDNMLRVSLPWKQCLHHSCEPLSQ